MARPILFNLRNIFGQIASCLLHALIADCLHIGTRAISQVCNFPVPSFCCVARRHLLLVLEEGRRLLASHNRTKKEDGALHKNRDGKAMYRLTVALHILTSVLPALLSACDQNRLGSREYRLQGSANHGAWFSDCNLYMRQTQRCCISSLSDRRA